MLSNAFAWWQTGVIYQIYPRSFNDSDGDGVGDLQGIIDRLDYLNDGTPDSLGVDAIWISPIYPSPMADFGYDVANYVDIDPLFGDLKTFDRLLAEAHQRGLRVILDFVPNHTSDEHPWFMESRSSRNNPRRDWYIWRDAQPDGSPPNNWASMFGGGAWTWDERTGQYYLHLFHAKQPDLNWRNPAVKAPMLDGMRFWLDRGVDGFRIDVIGYLVKDAQFRDNPVRSGLNHPNNLWSGQDHVYDIDQPEVHDIIREFRALADSYGDRVLIGEVWAVPRSRWVQYYGAQLDGLHLPFNFELLHLPWNADAFRASVDNLETALPAGAWPNYVLGSHDISRLATRFGEQAVRVAAMLLLTLRGTPTIYNGEEIGMKDGVIPLNRIRDPQGLNISPDRSRDPCRTPFQWSAAPYAGFSNADPWLPVTADYTERNVEAQRPDSRSVLSLYRRLLHYRKARSTLNRGTYTPVDGVPAGCFAYLREYERERCLIALNFSGGVRDLSLEGIEAGGSIVISTELDRMEAVSSSQLILRPNEGVILEFYQPV
jgi:alpha-glucosidase